MIQEGISFIKDLSGFSGCKIKLYSKGSFNFVRKISASKDYNSRLESQMNKQIYFYENLMTKNLRAPKVINSGEIDGLFFFDMEYVRGITLVEHVLESSPKNLKKISRMLIEMLKLMKSTQRNSDIDVSLKINLKLNQIKSKMTENYSELNDIQIPELSLKESFCHGDLTFENIIYDKESGNYYLIDFLDSFIDNYFFDIVKLFQDLEGYWYLLRNPKIDKKLMEIKMFFIKEFILNNFLIDEDYLKYHKNLLKLNFARILPYASGEKFEKVLKIIRAI